MKKVAVSKTTQLATAAGLLVAAGASQAAIDTATILSAITDGGIAAGVVGVAFLGVVATIKALKVIRSAM